MADSKPTADVKEIAGGWITEKKGTDVPAFLKGAYFVIYLGCLIYLIVYMYGEVSHSDRGALVKQFNQTAQTSEGLMYGVAVLTILFFAGMVTFAFSRKHDD